MKGFILSCLLLVQVLAHHTKVGEYHLQQKNVCFGSKDRKPGTFTMKNAGVILAIKLVHVSDKIACHGGSHGLSNFGCGSAELGTLVTDKNNQLLFPEKIDGKGSYKIPGFVSNSKEIVLDNPLTNPYVEAGDELKIWYGEDYKKYWAGDNVGKSCVNVYAMIRPVDFKLQASSVCFTGKDSGYGEFKVQQDGSLTDIKLVHKSGSIGCRSNDKTNFGCDNDKLLTLVTLDSNKIIFPRDTREYTLPQYTPMSDYIILNNPKYNPDVKKGQALRVWYGEDLKNHWEGDNPGKNCVDVYANIRPSNYKLVQSNLCIGAMGASYGTFTVKSKGILRSVKLQYTKGSVSCRNNGHRGASHWGCGISDEISILMTNTKDEVLIPHKGTYSHGTGRFKVPGYTTMSNELVLNYPNDLLKVKIGNEFRLWYGEDLFNHWEGDNGRQKVCANVYADIHEEYIPRCQGEDNGCCTADHPCLKEEGDCDNDSHCAGSLTCGHNNCAWGDSDDCCK